jgi:hypothetical protein
MSMQPSRREFITWVTASGIALSVSRLAIAEEPPFAARETLPGRQRWNPAATGAETEKRGMKPFLPPAVAFGSKQWPTLITPAPGPTSLADLP